jgi:signal transduction histidine kinase
VRLRLEAGGAADATLACDPHQVGRALDNLVLNAIQNSPPGGEVRLEVAPHRDGVAFRVRDAGPGVPEALRERLFEPFVTGRAEGSGLGLAIVREIARAHGGSARLVAEPGAGAGADAGAGAAPGTTFELDLPWQRS